MSPQSRSRKPTPQRSEPLGAVPGPGLALPGLEPLYAALLRDSAELPSLAGPLQAELWVSGQLGLLERAAPDAPAHRRALADLVGYLRRSRTPGARTFLRALAAIGPQRLRADAARAAAANPSVPEPAWAALMGAVMPGETWLVQDGSLGGDHIVCEFRYTGGGGPLHALLAQLTQGSATQLTAIGDVPGMMAQLRKGVADEECAVLRLSPAAAGTRLRAALDDGTPHPEDYYATLAFARHRIERLP